MDDFLPKPFGLGLLARCLQRVVARTEYGVRSEDLTPLFERAEKVGSSLQT